MLLLAESVALNEIELNEAMYSTCMRKHKPSRCFTSHEVRYNCVGNVCLFCTPEDACCSMR